MSPVRHDFTKKSIKCNYDDYAVVVKIAISKLVFSSVRTSASQGKVTLVLSAQYLLIYFFFCCFCLVHSMYNEMALIN